MEEVPRRTSLAPLESPCFLPCLIEMETEGFLDYKGRAGIISIVRWSLRPVMFGVQVPQTFSGTRDAGKNEKSVYQRIGGVERERGAKLMNDTPPPQKGFWADIFVHS